MSSPSTSNAPTARRPRRRAALGLVALALAVLGAAPAAATTGASAETPRQRVIVRFADGVDARAEAAAATRAGGRVSEVYARVFPGIAVELPAEAVTALERRPDVVAVTPDRTATLLSGGTQNGATWGLDRSDQRALPRDNVYQYPGIASGVRAYVVDTGILPGHADFGGRVTTGRTWVSDGNGTSDCNGHGTHVAGTIGGATWGIAKGVTLVPLRVFGCTGGASYSSIIAALDWVIANHPAGTRGVVNMSLGGGADSNMDAAVARTVSAGIPVVVAAGNSNVDACNTSPARAASAVTVGATTSSDARASYSNFGTCLDLFAPGSSITSAWYTSTTATSTISGTSMASPHVAGAIALVLAADPTLTASAARDRLVADATSGVVTSAGTGSPNRLLFVAPPAAPGPLSVSTAELPKATVGTAYSTTLTSTGGIGSSRTWSLTGGTLPGGLTLSSAGVLSGTPSTATTGTSLTFTVADGTATASRSLTLVIDAAPTPPTTATVDASVSNVLVTGRWLAAAAAVMTFDTSGPRPGVLVEGRWLRNGSLLRRTSGTTGADGIVSFTSGTVKATTGTLTFCVDRLSGTGVTTRTFTSTERCQSVTK